MQPLFAKEFRGERIKLSLNSYVLSKKLNLTIRLGKPTRIHCIVSYLKLAFTANRFWVKVENPFFVYFEGKGIE